MKVLFSSRYIFPNGPARMLNSRPFSSQIGRASDHRLILTLGERCFLPPSRPAVEGVTSRGLNQRVGTVVGI